MPPVFPGNVALSRRLVFKEASPHQFFLGALLGVAICGFSKKGLLPARQGIILSKEQCPKTPQEEEDMRRVPYASAVGSLMYAMLCTRPDICLRGWDSQSLPIQPWIGPLDSGKANSQVYYEN